MARSCGSVADAAVQTSQSRTQTDNPKDKTMKTKRKSACFLSQFHGRENGTYVVITACGRWGRGSTILEAKRNCQQMGASKFAPDCVVVAWQPIDERGLPGVDGDGFLSYYGKIDYLWRPSPFAG